MVESRLNNVGQRLQDFVEYAQSLDGRERAEAQVFCDRLFQAFGRSRDRLVLHLDRLYRAKNAGGIADGAQRRTGSARVNRSSASA